MLKSRFSHEQIIQAGQFTSEDIKEIMQRRRDHNRLGFAYQLAFVRPANRFPTQQPMELLPELLTYVGVQLGIKSGFIRDYSLHHTGKHKKLIESYRSATFEMSK